MERVRVPLPDKDWWGPFQVQSVCSLTCLWLWSLEDILVHMIQEQSQLYKEVSGVHFNLIWHDFFVLGAFGHLKKSLFGSHFLFFFPQGKMIYNQYPLIFYLNLFIYDEKFIPWVSIFVCVCLWSVLGMCSELPAQILDQDQPLPFSAANKNPVDSGELWECRKRSKFLQQEMLKAFDMFRILSQHFNIAKN